MKQIRQPHNDQFESSQTKYYFKKHPRNGTLIEMTTKPFDLNLCVIFEFFDCLPKLLSFREICFDYNLFCHISE